MSRKWTCGLCNGDVVEGQRFTFIAGIGAVHVECLNKQALSRVKGDPSDIVALLDVNEVLLYAIVRFKEAEAIALSDEVKSVITDTRREIEKLAGRIAVVIGRKIEFQTR